VEMDWEKGCVHQRHIGGGGGGGKVKVGEACN
jgi:hypothetical protein